MLDAAAAKTTLLDLLNEVSDDFSLQPMEVGWYIAIYLECQGHGIENFDINVMISMLIQGNKEPDSKLADRIEEIAAWVVENYPQSEQE